MVMGRNGTGAESLLDRLFRDLGAAVIAFDAEQLAIARDAAARFGRGRHAASTSGTASRMHYPWRTTSDCCASVRISRGPTWRSLRYNVGVFVSVSGRSTAGSRATRDGAASEPLALVVAHHARSHTYII